jgi:hypothetical protein
MVGCNNSVLSRLKAVSPFCVQLKCICLSLAKCVQYALFKLPSNIVILLSEIPNWFHQTELPPFSLKKPFTWWLVRGKVMFHILMNWEDLKAYFTSAELAQSQFDTKFKVRLLKEMLSDNKNYLFFEFATSVVQEFERLNSLF